MRCNQCGEEIMDKSNFCTRCGAPIIAEKQHTQKENTKKQSKGIIGMIIGIVFILLVASGAFFYYVNEGSHLEEKFKETIKNYEKVLEVAHLEDVEEYEDLLVECEEILSQHEKDMYPYLQEKLQKAMDKIEKEANIEVAALPDKDEPYKEKWEHLFTTEEENQQFTDLLNQLESAKKNDKSKTVEKVSQEIENLVERVRKANKADLEGRQSKVESIVLNGMTKGEEMLVQGLKEDLTKWCGEENYDEAFSVIQEWESFVDSFEKESEYKKQMEELQQEKEKLEQQKKEQERIDVANRRQVFDDDFIIYDSNSRYLTYADLQGLSKYELLIARNEIYARRGRCFVNQDLQNYFNSKSWYYPTIAAEDFAESMLNDYEKSNAYFIKEYEESMGY